MLRRHNKVRLSRRGGIFKDDLRFLDGITASEGVIYQDRKIEGDTDFMNKYYSLKFFRRTIHIKIFNMQLKI